MYHVRAVENCQANCQELSRCATRIDAWDEVPWCGTPLSVFGFLRASFTPQLGCAIMSRGVSIARQRASSKWRDVQWGLGSQ